MDLSSWSLIILQMFPPNLQGEKTQRFLKIVFTEYGTREISTFQQGRGEASVCFPP